MMRSLLVLLAACHVPDATTTLRARTQQLLDAVSNGDPRVWDRYLDPQIIYVSEAGEIETKAQLLKEVTPLPAGISGSIAVGRFEVRQHGDTAIVLHVDEESENYFGHPLHAQYLNVATWRYAGGDWSLIGQQVYASLIDPPAVVLPNLDEYAGSYALTDTIHYVITRDGDHLVGTRTGRPPQVLRAEARDVFFVPGQPRSRKIFQRAGDTLTGFADRREGRDVVWKRGL